MSEQDTPKPGPYDPSEPISTTLRRAACILKAKRWIKRACFEGIDDPEWINRTTEIEQTPEEVTGVCALGAVYLATMDPKKPLKLQLPRRLRQNTPSGYVHDSHPSPAIRAAAAFPSFNDRHATSREDVLDRLEVMAEYYESKEAKGEAGDTESAYSNFPD